MVEQHLLQDVGVVQIHTILMKKAKSLPLTIENALILKSEMIIQTTKARKADVVNVEINGMVSSIYYPQGKR